MRRLSLSRNDFGALLLIFSLLTFGRLDTTAQPIFADTVGICPTSVLGTDTIFVDLLVSDFDNVTSVQFSLEYDPAVLTLVDFNNPNTPDWTAQLSFFTGGASYVGLAAPGIPGATFPDGFSLVRLSFVELQSIPTTVTFSDTPTPIEITVDDNGAVQIAYPNLCTGVVNDSGAGVSGTVTLAANNSCGTGGSSSGVSNILVTAFDGTNTVLSRTAPDGSYYVPTLPSTTQKIWFTLDDPLYAMCVDTFFNIAVATGTVVIDNEVETTGAYITGHLASQDQDCVFDASDQPLKYKLITFDGNGITEVVSTNGTGYFNVLLPVGTYNVSYNNSIYTTMCQNNFQVTLGTVGDTTTVDLLEQVAIECPFMEVSISTPFLRRCFTNFYYVDYCNQGTSVATDASIEVTLDPDMDAIDALIPYTENNGVLTFELGDVEPGECSSFWINTFLDSTCDSTVLGQTHCVEAYIFPDTLCIPSNSSWSGASINVNGTCLGDSIEFLIINDGTGDMDQPLEYIIIEDAVMFAPQPFQLNAGEQIAFRRATNGATLRLEADQVAGHPGNSQPSVALEGCTTGTNFSTGFITQFSQDDANLFVDIDCQENIGAYDPNDKQGFPRGYESAGFIKANTPLEYHIRFQNTGTDTAFNVVIEDVLPEELDLTTLRVGASSHDYDWELTKERKLIFYFNDIMLPDSNINEPLSHGFVRFKIDQNPDLSDGTTFENEAGIFFDFNDPIITNRTLHTIGTDFLPVSTIQVFVPDVKVELFPNPFSTRTSFRFSSTSLDDLQLSVFSSTGQLVRQEAISTNVYDFDRRGLPEGLYFFEIRASGQSVATGKMIIQ